MRAASGRAVGAEFADEVGLERVDVAAQVRGERVERGARGGEVAGEEGAQAGGVRGGAELVEGGERFAKQRSAGRGEEGVAAALEQRVRNVSRPDAQSGRSADSP